MKTNVIFKNGLNLVCEQVEKGEYSVYMYFHNLIESKAIELMNECLTNNWSFSQIDYECHPKALRINVPCDQVSRFAWTF